MTATLSEPRREDNPDAIVRELAAPFPADDVQFAPLERDAIYDFVEHMRLNEIDHIARLGGGSASGR